MYFDAVLDTDMQVLFNGTPEETKKWLESRSEEMLSHITCVVDGKTLRSMSVLEYLGGMLA